MSTNAFKCPKCGEYTRHISISLREAASIEICEDTSAEKAAKVVGELAASFWDVLGAGKVAKHVVGISPYKCCKCGWCTWRKSNGEIKENIGYSK